MQNGHSFDYIYQNDSISEVNRIANKRTLRSIVLKSEHIWIFEKYNSTMYEELSIVIETKASRFTKLEKMSHLFVDNFSVNKRNRLKTIRINSLELTWFVINKKFLRFPFLDVLSRMGRKLWVWPKKTKVG